MSATVDIRFERVKNAVTLAMSQTARRLKSASSRARMSASSTVPGASVSWTAKFNISRSRAESSADRWFVAS
jgi:hypothetical protein